MANILNIIPYKILPVQTGGQKAIALFCKYLGKEHTLTAVSVKGNDITKAENYELINIFSESQFRYINPSYFFKLKKIIRQRKISHLIIEHPYMAWMAYLLKKYCEVEWYVRSHNIEYLRFKSLNKWWWQILMIYEKWVYKSADKILFITDEDAEFAISNLNIKRSNTALLEYGIEQQQLPQDIFKLRKDVYQQYEISEKKNLLLFNGALNYAPNYEAVDFITNELNPLLLNEDLLKYTIIICGKSLPERYNSLRNYIDKNIIYTGFVEDIEPYFKAAHLFLNPVSKGGGIKTKIIEAIAYNNTVVSFISGAAGINISVCGEKLIIVPDNDVEEFFKAIKFAVNNHCNTPQKYYEYYYYENVIKRLNLFYK